MLDEWLRALDWKFLGDIEKALRKAEIGDIEVPTGSLTINIA